MSYAVSPCLPFPSLSWWLSIARCGEVLLDGGEHFQKMSYRNRYRIATANGPLLLSLPLIGGRDQRQPVNRLRIDYSSNWPVQHWRSFCSSYGRAPFFEHYSSGIYRLLHARNELLIDFNIATVQWLVQALRLEIAISRTDTYEAVYPDAVYDLRKGGYSMALPRYTQVFGDRHGFLPDLSILDLLMNEGPAGWKRLLTEEA